MNLYDYIKSLADARHMTLTEVAEKAGIGEKSIYAWRPSKRYPKGITPRHDTLEKVARVFGMTSKLMLSELARKNHDEEWLRDLHIAFNSSPVNPKDKSTSEEIGARTARRINSVIAAEIKNTHDIPPYMAIVPDDIAAFPVIGTIKAGPDGIAYEDFQGAIPTVTQGLDMSKKHFYLRVNGDSMIGDGIHDGDNALIEQCDTVEEPGSIYAVLYDGDHGTLKHVTQSPSAIVLTPSNPDYKPIIIPETDSDEFHLVGKLKQIVKQF